MFTGIVKGLRPVESVVEKNGRRQLVIALDDFSRELEVGASVAINGTCLTTVALRDGVATFDVIQETLNCTNVGILKPGDLVNVDPILGPLQDYGGPTLTHALLPGSPGHGPAWRTPAPGRQ